jgi:DNA-binding response OmpR family regulator
MSFIVHTDNSDFFRKLMKIFLNELGHITEGYARGEDALDLLETGKADCVITGLELADMTGEEFIRRLMVSAHTAPVIVVTARDNDIQNARLNALGVRAIILKTGDWKNSLKEQLGNIG